MVSDRAKINSATQIFGQIVGQLQYISHIGRFFMAIFQGCAGRPFIPRGGAKVKIHGAGRGGAKVKIRGAGRKSAQINQFKNFTKVRKI